MTRLLIKGRGKGKTRGLIYTSEATGYPIVVQTLIAKDYLIKQAEEMNVIIPEPITLSDIKSGVIKNRHINNVLIDESYDIIGDALDEYLGCHVVATTLTDRLREFEQYR